MLGETTFRLHRKTKVFLMPESKKIALLVDGPNMRKYSKEAESTFNDVLRTIRKIAESYGTVDNCKAIVYFDINVRKGPSPIKHSMDNGFHVSIGSASRETFDIDEKLIHDAENYIKGSDIDILAVAAGDIHYLPLISTAREHGKEFLLIYPSGKTTSKRLLAASPLSEAIIPISPAAQPDLQNYRP